MNDTEWANLLQSLTPEERRIVDLILQRIGPELEALKQAVALLRFDIGVAERRSDGNSERVREAHNRIGNLSDRVHRLEDRFEPGAWAADLERVVWLLVADVEALKQARAAGDGNQ